MQQDYPLCKLTHFAGCTNWKNFSKSRNNPPGGQLVVPPSFLGTTAMFLNPHAASPQRSKKSYNCSSFVPRNNSPFSIPRSPLPFHNSPFVSIRLLKSKTPFSPLYILISKHHRRIPQPACPLPAPVPQVQVCLQRACPLCTSKGTPQIWVVFGTFVPLRFFSKTKAIVCPNLNCRIPNRGSPDFNRLKMDNHNIWHPLISANLR